MSYLFTSESVSEGHPDKVADQISDALIDHFLAYDPSSKVACETLVTTGQVFLAGEVKSKAYLDVQEIARDVVRKIGYTKAEYMFEANSCSVLSAIHEQSPDINQGVERKNPEEQGAGDQGMMFGYANRDTDNYMPLPLELSHLLLLELAAIRHEGKQMKYLRPDSKSQVTIEYNDKHIPEAINTIVISIQHDSEVVSVSYHEKVHEICVKNGPTYTSNICIMALHSEAMKHIQGVNHLPVLKKLEMTPLLRMYAVFPVSKGKSWFHDLGKFVSDSPIRYILPINERTIMITYTDGDDALFWMKKNPKQVPDQVMKRIRGLFPDLIIPDPLFFKMHPWKQGCTYWKPGKYSVEDESINSLHPMPKEMPGLFVCGESFALLQCWMECAVQQANKMMKHAAFQRVLKSVLTL